MGPRSLLPGLNLQSRELCLISTQVSARRHKRTHGYSVLVAGLGNCSTFLRGFGVGDGDWQLVNIDGRPLRVAVSVQIVVVGTDGILAQHLSQLSNGLQKLW